MMFIRCSSFIHRMLIGYSLDVRWMLIGGSSGVQQMFMDVHRMFSGCSLDCYRMFVGRLSDVDLMLI